MQIRPKIAELTSGDPFKLDNMNAIPRDGNIDIERSTNVYEVTLVGDVFQNPGPRRWPPVGTINLNTEGVFQIVQKCRERWQDAIARFKRVDPNDPHGKEISEYELGWDRPLDEKTFKSVASELAIAGARMFELLFEGNRGTPLEDVA
ncbi:MAG TPA: hypothetical protein VLZ74_13155 [Methylocella sp.]|nr:hypothetical protein [Methylocella sp.]